MEESGIKEPVPETKKFRILFLLFIQLVVLISSVSGIFTKLITNVPIFSIRFIIYYLALIISSSIFAIAWQQILKKMPLNAAYANKSVAVIWGLIFGRIFFNENITAFKITGSVMVIIGLILVVKDDV